MIRIDQIKSLPDAKFLNLAFTSAKSVSTDSRRVSRGQIFFALRGERYDGHSFVGEAIQKGAACAVVDRKWNNDNKKVSAVFPLVVVRDTTRALGELAQIYRRGFKIPIVAIAGSNGKTTTKEMTARVLRKKYNVLKTSGNFNNQIGVPLTLFQLREDHDFSVIEIGTNHFGEIERLCEIARPTAGLITNIGNEHLEFFRSTGGVKKEESKLFNYLGEHKGLVFINTDDKIILGLSKSLRHKFSYGFSDSAASKRNLSGRLIGFDDTGCAIFEMNHDGKKEQIHLKIPGIHGASNALAAAAVGFHFGVAHEDIKKALESYRSVEKRMQILRVGGVTILNDTYNSNPESTIAALRWLATVRSSGKKIAVLADMLELGASSVREHRRVGKEIALNKVDYLFTFGDLAREMAGSSDSDVKSESFDNKDELCRSLLNTVSAGDVVLVKGSRGMKMEEVVGELSRRLEPGGGR